MKPEGTIGLHSVCLSIRPSVCLSFCHSVILSVCHTSFPDFSWLCFHISEWKLVASFHMKSYRSSSTFVMVDLLFMNYCPLFKIRFPDFYWRNNGCRFEFVGAGGGPVLLLAILSVCLFNPCWVLSVDHQTHGMCRNSIKGMVANFWAFLFCKAWHV